MTDLVPGGSGQAGMADYANQKIASTPYVSAWVSASAGSGKTKVLADRVLRLMLEGTDPRKILCLTFTRAAAAEMQNRIRDLLSEWAIISQKELASAIQSLTGVKPKASELALARRLFAEVIDSPRGLMIQTIHAFCESLLGRFPVEAGLAPYFEVMDERTSGEALKIARDEVLSQARSGRENELVEALSTVTEWVQETEFAELIISIASNSGRLRRSIALHNGLKGAAVTTREFFKLATSDTVQALLWNASSDDFLNFDGLYDAAGALSQGGKQDKKRSKEIIAWLDASQQERFSKFSSYSKNFLTGSDAIRMNLVSKSVLKQSSHVAGVLQSEGERLYKVVEKRKAIVTADATQAILTLAISLIDRYEAYKQRNALLDYDDLILKARALVEGSASWVLYKLDGGIDHVLIDEAQDSNADQWAVVRAIVDEFFSGESARDVIRTVFAVGDEKQSIFSFQGAAPDEFRIMREYFELQAAAANKELHSVPLDVSFRSTAAVLQAVDAVFATEEVWCGVASNKISHKAHRLGQAGLVEVWPPVTPVDQETNMHFPVPGERQSTPRPARRLAHCIAGKIRGWLDNDETLQSANRSIQPKDIMVLVRRRTDFVDSLIRELKVRGVSVAGLDRMILTDQLAVRDLIALGMFVLMPHDDLNLAAVLKGPIVGLNENQVFNICHTRVGTVWASLSDWGKKDKEYAFAYQLLSDLLARADMTPPYEFFAYLLGAMNGRARLLARLRQEANDPIDEFLSLALAFEKSHVPSLHGFLRWLEQGQAEIKRDLDQGIRDEVRVMTVHGAKGLQAPIVILADTIQTPSADSDLLWADCGLTATSNSKSTTEELMIWSPRTRAQDSRTRRLAGLSQRHRDEEYRRLLYVAMTRAEDRLYVTGYNNRQNVSASAWWKLVTDGLEGQADRFDFVSHQGNEINSRIAWRGEGLRITTPQTATPDRQSIGQEKRNNFYEMPIWIDSPVPIQEQVSRPLTPSRSEFAEPSVNSPLNREDGVEYQHGILVHRLLQLLPNIESKDREMRARLFLERPIYGLSERKTDLLVEEVIGVLEHPKCKHLFGPTSRAEVPIVGLLNDVPVSGRIDRLVIEEKGIKLLDFKTNRVPAVTVEDVPKTYLRQMATYWALLKKIYKNQPIECILIWTKEPKLMQLDTQLLKGYLP